MKKIPILILEYKNYWFVANILYCLARTKMFEIHFLSRNTKTPFRFSPLIKSHHHFSPAESDEAFLNFAKKVTEKTKAQVLVPTSEATYAFIIQHKEAIQKFINVVPLPEKWAHEILMHKGLLGAFAIENNIPTPLTIPDLASNLEEKLEGFPFPVLLKPAVGAYGQGAAGQPPITFFSDKAKLIAFIKERNCAENYIVQSFVEGYEIDCNVMYKDGKLVTYTLQKALLKTKNYTPSLGIEFIDNQEAIGVVDQLMSKLKWNGVAHVDMIYDVNKKKLLILEVNPRYWLTIGGSMVTAKVNFPALTCLAALNQPISIGKEPSKLGKYIPLISFIKYKIASFKENSTRSGEKVRFKWKDIDSRYYFIDLFSRACYYYDKKFEKRKKEQPKAAVRSVQTFTQTNAVK